MHDIKPLLILEGLPCCGKTTVGRALRSMGVAQLCDEIMVDIVDPKVMGRTAAIKNDWLKTEAARRREQALVLDRYIYSTVAYEIASGVSSIDRNLVRSQLYNLIDPAAIPRHEVIVWLPNVSVSIQRVRSDRRQEHGPEWSDPVFLRRFAEAYRVMFDDDAGASLGIACHAVHWVTEEQVLCRALSIVAPRHARTA